MKQRVWHVLFLLMVVIGIILTLKSINIGGDYASKIVRLHGGSLDSATYQIYLQEYIRTFRELGLALLVLGGLGEIATILKSSN